LLVPVFLQQIYIMIWSPNCLDIMFQITKNFYRRTYRR